MVVAWLNGRILCVPVDFVLGKENDVNDIKDAVDECVHVKSFSRTVCIKIQVLLLTFLYIKLDPLPCS